MGPGLRRDDGAAAKKSSRLDDLRQLARLVALGHFFQRNRRNLRRHAFATERLEARLTDQAGGFARWLQVIARVEFRWVLEHVLANRGSHGKADIGVDI